MYDAVVLEISKHDFDEVFERPEEHGEGEARYSTDAAEDLQQVIVGYQKLVQKKTGKPFPQDAMEQLQGARDAVFRSCRFNVNAPSTTAR